MPGTSTEALALSDPATVFDVKLDSSEQDGKSISGCGFCGVTFLRPHGQVFDFLDGHCCRTCKPTHCTDSKILGFSFLVLSVVVGLFLSILFIGESVEFKKVNQAQPTNSLYDTLQVCAVKSNIAYTYSNVTFAHVAGAKVAHCGACGACSTKDDIAIYASTRNTLTKTATTCGTKAFLGRAAVEKCYIDEVGFSDTCNNCWVDNVMCDYRNCVFTCLKMIIFNERNNVDGGGLNACLNCDEKICGTAFLQCAGANRRRCGIVSDIAREQKSLCQSVDADIWS